MAKTIKSVLKRDLIKFKKDIREFDKEAYFRSVYANKFTLAGIGIYALSLSLSTFLLPDYNSLTSPPAEFGSYACLLTGLLFLGGTAFGKTTYDTYRKAEKIISRKKNIPAQTIDKCLNTYCNTVGINLARKDAGLMPLEMINMLN